MWLPRHGHSSSAAQSPSNRAEGTAVTGAKLQLLLLRSSGYEDVVGFFPI